MDMEMALGLVKARLNRPPGDTALDAYFKKRIEGAAAKLKRLGKRGRYDAPRGLHRLAIPEP